MYAMTYTPENKEYILYLRSLKLCYTPNYSTLPDNIKIIDSPEDIHPKLQVATYIFEGTKARYLLDPEKNNTDAADSNSDFDNPVHDIVMIDKNVPDPYLARLKTLTLTLTSCYSLYVGFREAG